jgi:hypothetical protein
MIHHAEQFMVGDQLDSATTVIFQGVGQNVARKLQKEQSEFLSWKT